jgi:hypothetical protein
MEAHEINNRIKELNDRFKELEREKQSILDEHNSYFYQMTIYYASDSFNQFKEENPNHPLLQYCKVLRPEQTGLLSDVTINIRKHDISKEDFIEFAKLISDNYRGEDAIQSFRFRYKNQ